MMEDFILLFDAPSLSLSLKELISFWLLLVSFFLFENVALFLVVASGFFDVNPEVSNEQICFAFSRHADEGDIYLKKKKISGCCSWAYFVVALLFFFFFRVKKTRRGCESVCVFVFGSGSRHWTRIAVLFFSFLLLLHMYRVFFIFEWERCNRPRCEMITALYTHTHTHTWIPKRERKKGNICAVFCL